MKRMIRRVVIIAAAMSVSSAAAMSCVASSGTQLVFGRYDPWSPSHHDMLGTVEIVCTPASPGEIADVTVRLQSYQPGPLFMRNLDTGEQLRFDLYQDAARARPLVDGLLFSLRVPLAVPLTFPFTLYGRIPAGQQIGVGRYSTALTVLVEY